MGGFMNHTRKQQNRAVSYRRRQQQQCRNRRRGKIHRNFHTAYGYRDHTADHHCRSFCPIDSMLRLSSKISCHCVSSSAQNSGDARFSPRIRMPVSTASTPCVANTSRSGCFSKFPSSPSRFRFATAYAASAPTIRIQHKKPNRPQASPAIGSVG